MNTGTPDRPALLIFAKAPVPGRVKTRLVPDLSPMQAADLYRAFLLDALAQYAEFGVALRLYVAPPLEELPPDTAPSGVSLHSQQGNGLGERMQRAFIETFAAGYGRVVVVGTDHPSLPSDFISLAFEALETPLSICIGPSEDGGYYLLGMNDVYPGLFQDMSYSHPDVFADTMERIEQTRADVTILPAWYDVDTAADLDRLASDLQDVHIHAPNTRAVLARLGYPTLRESTRP
ncbi:MAG TPA: TIGR04282 family arsenosugar biosynthesis glycosyltransferase [Rhodothermales bacterium]|nr:TIGR04282 family arsenosugar biosynthesis glycosyltransferase [Rhodothermales bacterium]